MIDFTTMELLAAARIKKAYDFYGDSIYLGHSGGKDSAVVFHLASQLIPDLTILHTTKELSTEDKSYPTVPVEDATFLYELAQRRPIYMVPMGEMPRILKRLGLRCQIDGTRRDESERHDRSSTYFCDGKDHPRENMPDSIKNGLFGLDFLYPIFDWTTEEVWAYIRYRNIEVSKSYTR